MREQEDRDSQQWKWLQDRIAELRDDRYTYGEILQAVLAVADRDSETDDLKEESRAIGERVAILLEPIARAVVEFEDSILIDRAHKDAPSAES